MPKKNTNEGDILYTKTETRIEFDFLYILQSIKT